MKRAIRLSVRGLFAVCIGTLILTSNRAVADPPAQTITVGTLTLKLCDTDFNGYCGSMRRRLDPSGGVKGQIQVAFVYYPRFDQTRPALGTLLPQEGGPGYSTRGTAAAYLNIYGRLRENRDVLIVDKRGTGLSDAVDCPEIQTGDPADAQNLKDCGKELGKKAPLYNTRLAVDDIIAVMDALQVKDVDYYGDSYGTYVGQVFAAFILIACGASSWIALIQCVLRMHGFQLIGLRA